MSQWGERTEKTKQRLWEAVESDISEDGNEIKLGNKGASDKKCLWDQSHLLWEDEKKGAVTSFQTDQDPWEALKLFSGAVSYLSLHPDDWRVLGSGANNFGGREEGVSDRQKSSKARCSQRQTQRKENPNPYTLLCAIWFCQVYFAIGFHPGLNLFFTEPKRRNSSYFYH